MVGFKLDAYSTSPDSDEVLLTERTSQDLVCRSSYIASLAATCKVNLSRGLQEVVLLPELTTEGTVGVFTLEVHPPTAATLELVPQVMVVVANVTR